MSYYCNSYLNVLKRNLMLVIIAAVLLVVTFFIWSGIPFIIGSAVAGLTTSQFLVNLCMALSVAIIFSLYFFPINLKVAQNIANTKKRSTFNSFIRIEIVWIVVITSVLQIILSTFIQ